MSGILITGAAGMIGRALLDEMLASGLSGITASDLSSKGLREGIPFRLLDVTGEDAEIVIGDLKPDVVVHLASIVTPPPGLGRQAAYAVDVDGTRKVLEACIKHSVRRLVVTSSGAAYGYHADNPVPLRESDPCRGNPEFAYADHKRSVEEMLAKARIETPELEQTVLRVGTVLGEGTRNQITALFHKSRLLAITGCESPFVFIWTRDLARILLRAATNGPAGIYNVAGDGALGVTELATRLGKPILRLPAWVFKMALGIAKPLGLSRYGPEQVRFLQYRPVLANDALKEAFGYTPEKTSAEVFDLWRESVGL